MKFLLSLVLYVFYVSTTVLSHSAPHVSSQNQQALIQDISFPDLVNVKSIDEIKKNWNVLGEVQFNEGRIILTPTPSISSNSKHETIVGQLWSAKKHSLTKFSAELTLRSVGSFGLTGAWFSFWLIEDDSSKTSESFDSFGGPLKYSGLQVLVDANDPSLGPVLRVYLNDGSKEIKLAEDFIGAYAYEFQDSQVPMTLKIGYDNNWLKITCDNKLLFETNKINLNSILPKMKVGITASAPKDVIKTEQFEVLMFKFYNEVLDDLKIDPSESLFAKHADIDTKKQDRRLDAANFRQRQEELRAKLVASGAPSDSVINEINLRLQQLEAVIASGSSNGADSVTSKESQVLQRQLFDMNKSIKVLTESLNSYQANFLSYYEELLRQNENLNLKQDSITQLIQRQNQIIEEFDNRFLKMNKHMESQSQNHINIDNKLKSIETYYQSNSNNGVDSYRDNIEDNMSKLASIVKLILIPVLGLLVVVALLVYKLRSDIKHSKVL